MVPSHPISKVSMMQLVDSRRLFIFNLAAFLYTVSDFRYLFFLSLQYTHTHAHLTALLLGLPG